MFPIAPGDIFSCGDYHFEIVPLYGHTSGQCGLVERNKKLFFCADQVILGLTPIVITAGKDQHLLAEYFASLKELTADYTGYRFLPGHYGEFNRGSARRLSGSSLNMRHAAPSFRLALAESRLPDDTFGASIRHFYVQRMQTYRYSYLFSYLNTWPKLFSCLDWLAETGVIRRAEKTASYSGRSAERASDSLFENTQPQ